MLLVAVYFLAEHFFYKHQSSAATLNRPVFPLKSNRESPVAPGASERAVTVKPASASSVQAVAEPSLFDELVEHKYAILFSTFKLTPAQQVRLNALLVEREKIASKNFYDASSNELEIAAGLREREAAVAQIDENIQQFLGAEQGAQYELLKDSTYEQSRLIDFYMLSDMGEVSESLNQKLLLAKLAAKQKLEKLIATEGEMILSAAQADRPRLIAQLHSAINGIQETYLTSVQTDLSQDQFDTFAQYEQQQADERWRDLTSSFK